MTETVYLRSDAGVSCTGLASPRALGAAQTSVQTQLLAAGTPGTNYFWTVEQTARTIEAGDWTVSLRIEAGGPNQAQAQVRCRVEHRNSSCALLDTLVDDTQGVGTSGTDTFTYSESVGQVELSAGDRIVVRVERTNSTNRTATLRFAGSAPDNSNLLHPAAVADAEPVEITLVPAATSTVAVPMEPPAAPVDPFDWDTTDIAAGASYRQLVRTSNGDLYAVVWIPQQASEGHGWVALFKSTDDGATWEEQDPGGRPGPEPTRVDPVFRNCHIALDSTGVIHLAWLPGGPEGVCYGTFDTATGTYTRKEVILTEAHEAGEYQDVSIAVDSADTPHLAMSFLDDGSGEGFVEYLTEDGSGWHFVDVESAFSTINLCTIEVDDNDLPVIVFGYSGDLYAGIGDDTLAMFFTVALIGSIASSFNNRRNHQGSVTVDAANTVWVAYVNASGHVAVVKHLDADPWADWQTPTSSGESGTKPSIALLDGKAYVTYTDGPVGGVGDDLFLSVLDGSTWDPAVELQAGGLGGAVVREAKRNNADNDTYGIDYLWWSATVDAGTTHYGNLSPSDGVTVTLVPAEAASQAVPAAPTGGPLAVTLTPAEAATVAVPVTPTVTPVVTWTAGSALVQGSVGVEPVTVTLVPAEATAAAQTTVPTPATLTVGLTAASAATEAQPTAPAPGPFTVDLAAAAVSTSAAVLQVQAADQPVTVNLTPAVAAASAQTFDPTPAELTADLTPATTSATAQPLAPAFGQVAVNLTPALTAVAAQPTTVEPAGYTTDLTAAETTTAAQPLSPASDATTVTLASAATAVSAQPADVQPAALTTGLEPAQTSATAAVLEPQVAVAVILAPATVATSARQLAIAGGPVHVALETATVTATALTVVVEPGGFVGTLTAAGLETAGQATQTTLAPLAVPAAAATIATTAQPTVPQAADAPVTVNLTPAATGVVAQTVAPIGAVVVTLTPASVTVDAGPLDVQPAVTVVALHTALAATSAQPAVLEIGVGVTVAPAHLTVEARTFTVETAPATIPLAPATVAVDASPFLQLVGDIGTAVPYPTSVALLDTATSVMPVDGPTSLEVVPG